MMFEDYIACVLNEYQTRLALNQLSLNLKYPTAAKLKAESLDICTRRFFRRDEKLLSSFFGTQDNQAAYCLAIKRSEADLFKPLRNFLKGDTDKTQEKNIELLAWLIDFEPRPYQLNHDYKISIVQKSQHRAQEQKLKSPAPLYWSKRSRRLWPAISILAILIACLLFFFIQKNDIRPVSYSTQKKSIDRVKNPRKLLNRNGVEGMYWAGDHFERTTLKKKKKGQLLYELDTAELLHFKKIMEPETLTCASAYKVCYYASRDSIEYFTTFGFHPLIRDKILKPVTYNIIKYYIRPKILRAANSK